MSVELSLAAILLRLVLRFGLQAAPSTARMPQLAAKTLHVAHDL